MQRYATLIILILKNDKILLMKGMGAGKQGSVAAWNLEFGILSSHSTFFPTFGNPFLTTPALWIMRF
jgi:hypothetical protein